MTSTRIHPILIPILLLATLATLTACGGERRAEAAPASAGPVDSIRPPAVALEEFRRGLPPTDTLAGGAPSRDSLVARFVRAVAQSDTAAVRGMVLSRAEYAYLYFPSLQHMNPGVNMQPEVMWLLHSQESLKGITRVLRRLGGGQSRLGGYACEEAPQVEGEHRYWHRCAIDVTAPDGAAARLQLFGSIVEHGGKFKIVSYANDF
jgi:hypothetical protein